MRLVPYQKILALGISESLLKTVQSVSEELKAEITERHDTPEGGYEKFDIIFASQEFAVSMLDRSYKTWMEKGRSHPKDIYKHFPNLIFNSESIDEVWCAMHYRQDAETSFALRYEKCQTNLQRVDLLIRERRNIFTVGKTKFNFAEAEAYFDGKTLELSERILKHLMDYSVFKGKSSSLYNWTSTSRKKMGSGFFKED